MRGCADMFVCSGSVCVVHVRLCVFVYVCVCARARVGVGVGVCVGHTYEVCGSMVDAAHTTVVVSNGFQQASKKV